MFKPGDCYMVENDVLRIVGVVKSVNNTYFDGWEIQAGHDGGLLTFHASTHRVDDPKISVITRDRWAAA